MTASAQASPGASATASFEGVLALPGARLAYQVTGTRPAVVLVHGFGLDMRRRCLPCSPAASRAPGTTSSAALAT